MSNKYKNFKLWEAPEQYRGMSFIGQYQVLIVHHNNYNPVEESNFNVLVEKYNLATYTHLIHHVFDPFSIVVIPKDRVDLLTKIDGELELAKNNKGIVDQKEYQRLLDGYIEATISDIEDDIRTGEVTEMWAGLTLNSTKEEIKEYAIEVVSNYSTQGNQ